MTSQTDCLLGMMHLSLLFTTCSLTLAFHSDSHVSRDDAGSPQMISGLAASRRHPGILYAINDNKGQGDVYMLDATDGSVKGVLVIQHVRETDWEDIAVGPCPDSDSCIFVADTGAGAHYSSQKTIYRVKEPDYVYTQDIPLDGTYKYTWGVPSSEAMMVDLSGNIYILSETTGSGSKLGELPSDGWNSNHATQVKTLVNLPFSTHHKGPLAADISPDGTKLLIKTLNHVYEWAMPDRNVVKAMGGAGKQLQYTVEHQGEAIAWSSDGSGYYTIGQGANEKLHYHKLS